MSKTKYERCLALYKQAIDVTSGIELKGKNMPYTSANGHMYSQLNKDGELGIRLSKKDREDFYKEYGEEPYLSYGAVMIEYVKIPDALLAKPKKIGKYLAMGANYVNTLKPK